MRDMTIKANTYCQVHKGIVLTDCVHDASDFSYTYGSMEKTRRDAVGQAANVAHAWAKESGLSDGEADELRNKIRSLHQ